MRSAGADCDFAFAGSASYAKIFDYFRAEGFHQMPASSLSGTKLLYRRLLEFQPAAWLARSIPATPRKSWRQSLQIAGWRKNGAFLRQEFLRPAAPCRRQEYAPEWPRKLKQQDPRAHWPWQ